MKITIKFTLIFTPLICFAAGKVPPSQRSSPVPKLAQPVDGYGNLPLAFEPNVGQTDPQVRFLTRSQGTTVFFTDNEAVMVLRKTSSSRGRATPFRTRPGEPPTGPVEQEVVKMKLVGAAKPRQAAGLEKLAGVTNYFIGSDPAKWRTDVPNYARFRYEGVYAGVDLVCYGKARQLEYDLVVAPWADPKQIELAWEGVDGLRLNGEGDLVLTTQLGDLIQKRPRVYQEIGERRVEVVGSYSIREGRRVQFEVARYDHSRPLVIDPVVTLVYSTFLGGADSDIANGIAVDSAGATYVTGLVSSLNFPTQSGYQPQLNGWGYNAFVAKLAAAGSSLIYSTFLGGSGADQGTGIAVDSTGAAYVTGRVTSSDFPTQSAYQATLKCCANAFVTKLMPAGNALAYSTYLGGGTDTGNGIAVDSTGSAYVTGDTASATFPTTSAFQSTLKGTSNAFVTKLAPAGNTLVYSTFLGGGSSPDGGYGDGIAVDTQGSAYVTGFTFATDFPTKSAYQTALKGYTNAFVTKLAPAGNTLVYSTYLGGSGQDYGYGIAIDTQGFAYVTGAAYSTNFPVQSAFQSTLKGTGNAFVTKLAQAGNALVYSTYLGGHNATSNDSGAGIAVDSAGQAYVTGVTSAPDFPIASAFQSTLKGTQSAFVTKLAQAGNVLVYSTYLGGSGAVTFGSAAIATDSTGAAYVTGYTSSPDFPTQSPYQPFVKGSQSAFVTKLGAFNLTASLRGPGPELASVETSVGPVKSDGPRSGQAPARLHMSQEYGKLPLAFEPNLGQTDPEVRYLSRTRGMTAFFTDSGVTLALGGAAVVGMRLAGARTAREVAAEEKLPGVSNYFIGNDPKKWRSNVPHYGRIQYREVYPGVDMVCYGNQGQLEYDLVVAPWADAGQLEVAWEGVDSLRLNQEGDVVLKTAVGELVQKRPKVYQETGGRAVEIASRYRVSGDKRVRFELARYDHARPLRIDPSVSLVYSTYLGGSGADSGVAIAVDSTGAIYVAGQTASINFPTRTPYQPALPGTINVFVTKLAARGTALVYSTYLGGTSAQGDWPTAMAVDKNGAPYVTGYTYSTDFPTQSAFQTTNHAGSTIWSTAFVTKLTPAGNALAYSTYLGGSTLEQAYGIAVDTAGSAYVVGHAYSSDFPLQTPFQSTLNGYTNGFVTKFTPAGNALVYSTYLGGSDQILGDTATSITVDSTGSAYVAGQTDSADFPTQSPYQATNKGNANAFVSKLAPAGNALVYSTYLGGSGTDSAHGIAVDATGAAYITGGTNSTNFPTQSPLQAALASPRSDAFVTKLAPAGNTLLYSTYLGGKDNDSGAAVAVDSTGSAYVVGGTTSTDFPLQNAYQSTSKGAATVFVAVVAPAGNSLTYSTYLGGNSPQSGAGIALDASGAIYVTGQTESSDFPSVSPYQASSGGGFSDAFVSTLVAPAGPSITVTTVPAGLAIVVDSVTLTAPQTFTWTTGSSHSISVTSPQGTGTRYVFANWSDTGAQAHNVTAPATSTTYTANFTTQYLLTTQASPTAGGSIAASPSSTDGYYASGASVQLTASANPGYQFTAWSGNLSGANNPQSVTMSAPRSVTASFSAVAGVSVTVGTTPSGLSVAVDGATLTAPQNFLWTPGSQHSIGMTSPQGTGSARYAFASWSDSGAQTHNVITPSVTTTYTANFSTQYLLTTQASPTAGGSITANPSSTDGYYASGAALQLAPVPANCEYQFLNWSGDIGGIANPASLTMSAPHNVTANLYKYRTFSDNGFFVCQQYLDLLNRAPDTSGYNYWVGLLNGSQATRGQVADAYFVSPEFQGNGMFIISAYIAVLGRNPDFAGWLYWLNNLQAGVTQQQVIDSFVQSTEFQQTYGTLSNTQFVTLVYQNVLGRAPDAGGLSYWVGQLNSGAATRGQCMDSFATSAEFQNEIQNQALSTLLYMGFLRRSPDPTGAAYWTGQLNGGIPAATVLTGFITSAEYTARF